MLSGGVQVLSSALVAATIWPETQDQFGCLEVMSVKSLYISICEVSNVLSPEEPQTPLSLSHSNGYCQQWHPCVQHEVLTACMPLHHVMSSCSLPQVCRCGVHFCYVCGRRWEDGAVLADLLMENGKTNGKYKNLSIKLL